MSPKPSKPPKLTKKGLPRKPRRTKAALASDAALCGQTVKGKKTRAELRQSRLAAEERERLATENCTTSRPKVTVSKSQGTSVTPKSRVPAAKSPAPTQNIPPASQSLVPASQSAQNGPLFQEADYERIISFLSVPKNRDMVFGSGQTRVSGLPMAPATYLSTLAKEINTDYNTRNQIFSRSKSCPNGMVMNLTGRTLEGRLRRYKTRYHKVKAEADKTGDGLSDEQRAKGFDSIKALLEHKCPFYYQMHDIFKDKPNVSAFAVMDTGPTSTSNPLPANQSPSESSSEPSEHESNTTHVSESEEEQTQENIHSINEDQMAPTQDSQADDYNEYAEAENQEFEDDDENNPDYRISTRQQSEARFQTLINSLPPDFDVPFNGSIDSFPAEFDFFTLPPPIEPPGGYFINMPPGNFSPIPSTQPVINNLDSNHNEATFPADTHSAGATTTLFPPADNRSIFPAEIDPIPELEFNSGTEDIPDKQPAPTTKKPSKKKHRKQLELTAAEISLDSGSDDSETLAPSQKKIKKNPSRKSTGPSTNIASRPMNPLPSIDPSAVRTKDIKNPIALAMMTSSQDRNKEIKSNNIWRRNLEITKRREAAAAEVIRKQEVNALKQFEQQKLEKEHLQAQIAERSRFAQSLIVSGKSPEEVTQYLAAVFPPLGNGSPSVASSQQSTSN